MRIDHAFLTTPLEEPLWAGIFGNDNPVEIEIGPGNGVFVLAASKRQPDTNFLAIEKSFSRARELEKIVGSRALHNVLVLRADAAFVLALAVPSQSVQAIHVYFPDPWWKQRHHRRRIFTPAFVESLARAVVSGGYVYIATDVEMIFDLMQKALRDSPHFREDPSKPSPRTTITKFENKGLLRGATIRQNAFLRR